MAYIGRDIQYGVLDKQSFTADSSTTAFTLDSGVKDAKSLLVSVGGVIQEPDVAYTASGTTLTFSTAPATGMVAYAIYLGKTMESGGVRDQITFQNETGDGTTTPFTLSATPANAQSIMVTLNGVTQVPGTDYNVAGTTITFTTAPVVGMGILVYHLGSAAAIGTIDDASVTDAKIVGMSASKLTGSLPANTVANTSIVSLDASKLTGTLPGSMAVDTTALDQTIASLGMHVAVADNKVSFNLPGVFIDQFESDSGILTETTVDRDATGEYFSSIVTVPGADAEWDYVTNNTPITFFGTGANPSSSPISGSTHQNLYNDNIGTQAFYWTSPSSNNQTGFYIDYGADYPWTKLGLGKANVYADITSLKFSYSTTSQGTSTWTPLDWTGVTFGSNYGSSTCADPNTFGTDGTFNWPQATSSDTATAHYFDGFSEFTARYLRVEIISWANSNNSNVGWSNFQPSYSTTTASVSATGTLISTASTADAATTTASGVMVYEDSSGTATLGTDLKIYFSADDGANWTEASSYGTPINFNGASKKMVKLGKTTGLTSGTQMKLKAEWANQVQGVAGSAAGYQTGDRTSTITITSNIVDPPLSNLVDGDFTTNGDTTFFHNVGLTSSKYIRFQFTSAQTIVEAKWYQSGTQSTASHGTWKWQGSNDGSSWANIGSNFTLGGVETQTLTELSGNTTSYTYYQLCGVSGTTNGYPNLNEIEFNHAGVTGVTGKETRLHGWAINY